MVEDRRVTLIPPYGKEYFRDWECGCGNKFTARVWLNEASREVKLVCPRCNKTPLRSSAAYPRTIGNGR